MKPGVASGGTWTHSSSVIWDKQTNLGMPKQIILPAIVFLVTVFKMTFLLLLEPEILVIMYLILDF